MGDGVLVSVQGEQLSKGGLCPRGCLSKIGSLSRGVSVLGSLCLGVSVQGGLCHRDPLYSNEQAVHILLECILVCSSCRMINVR